MFPEWEVIFIRTLPTSIRKSCVFRSPEPRFSPFFALTKTPIFVMPESLKNVCGVSVKLYVPSPLLVSFSASFELPQSPLPTSGPPVSIPFLKYHAHKYKSFTPQRLVLIPLNVSVTDSSSLNVSGEVLNVAF